MTSWHMLGPTVEPATRHDRNQIGVCRIEKRDSSCALHAWPVLLLLILTTQACCFVVVKLLLAAARSSPQLPRVVRLLLEDRP